MAAPPRGNTGYSCYFITASTFQKRSLFHRETMASLFLDVLFHYRQLDRYRLHEFVLMPDHYHLLITPTETLERALQLIKGGFSFRAKKDLGFGGDVWQKSFYDRRVRDVAEYCAYREYIYRNPVKRMLVSVATDYLYTSARPGFDLNSLPKRLNPISVGA